MKSLQKLQKRPGNGRKTIGKRPQNARKSHLVIRREQNIPGLDVAVHHAKRVQKLNPCGDLSLQSSIVFSTKYSILVQIPSFSVWNPSFCSIKSIIFSTKSTIIHDIIAPRLSLSHPTRCNLGEMGCTQRSRPVFIHISWFFNRKSWLLSIKSWFLSIKSWFLRARTKECSVPAQRSLARYTYRIHHLQCRIHHLQCRRHRF